MINKVKQISKYIGFNNPYETLWRQKIDESGKLQGTGFFIQMKVGKMCLEKRRTSNRKWRPISEARRKGYGFHKISLPLPVPYDWHHPNKKDVVAISRDIHKAISHKCGDGKLEGVVG